MPRCRTIIVPAVTSCPSPTLTPRRWPTLSRPFLELDPAFLWAIGAYGSFLARWARFALSVFSDFAFFVAFSAFAIGAALAARLVAVLAVEPAFGAALV